MPAIKIIVAGSGGGTVGGHTRTYTGKTRIGGLPVPEKSKNELTSEDESERNGTR